MVSSRLLRLDGADREPQAVGRNMSTYGGLMPWNGYLLAATKDHKVVQIDPFRNSSSDGLVANPIVDVPKALGLTKVADVFTVGGMTVCGSDALFIVYGGNSTAGHSGVLKCEGCTPDTECTDKCAVVDGGDKPGNGTHQLGGFAAGVTCAGDEVLVVDNANFRVQAIPASCPRSPCNISTFAPRLKWPLGIAKVSSNNLILVTLDASIVSVSADGSQRSWSQISDCGYLFQADSQVLVANGNIVSFDAGCGGPDCTATLVWNATMGIKVYGAVASVPAPAQ